jgi:hypothetical protein
MTELKASQHSNADRLITVTDVGMTIDFNAVCQKAKSLITVMAERITNFTTVRFVQSAEEDFPKIETDPGITIDRTPLFREWNHLQIQQTPLYNIQ